MPVSSNKLQEFTIKAANQSQIELHAKVSYVIWPRAQSYEEYWEVYNTERREAPWGKDAFQTWVLVHRADPEGEIYAACKTYRRKSFVKHRGADDIEDGYVYGMASVVTPKQHLRNGYATRLLSLLHRYFGPENTLPPIPESWGKGQPYIPLPPDIAPKIPKALGSILWSDVGSTFYSRCLSGQDRQGWVVDDALNGELVWKILPNADPLEEGYTWIYQEGLVSVGQELSMRVQNELRRSDTTERSIFMQDPANPGTLFFLPVKGAWMNPEFKSFPVGLRIKAPSGKSTEDAIVLFTVSNRSIRKRFLVTFVSNLDPLQLPSVLKAFDTLATKVGHEEGCVWGLDAESELVKAWKALSEREVEVGRREEVDGHLLGVAWYGREEDRGMLGDGQMWSWC
ncbi:Hypothetical protein CGB_E6360W [Cryptococcus gattii WM276]|uniref:N-acetyltransferase domain-containing protein n=1 Tax=Cryptococcus gattii serotype B (strain WM276 / ATCC MYA-4071) TaxID=367775 RepID=E6R663_CRYGW|nr:Hypothetical protein CGB_E6360W [Cryptococcus gattii WM276]ADV22688.1 Hypothetical protein CGB_E6360W [Cryptococcus gattii WM276]